MNGASEERLAEIRSRIDKAAQLAGRKGEEVRLIAISKTYDADAIRPLLEAGHRLFGENRVQEAQDKWPVLKADHPDAELHLVGRLQSNKARSVAGYAHAVHSVDRESLVAPLSRGAVEGGRPVGVFVQVSLDGDPKRGGVVLDRLPALAGAVAAAEGLELLGLMAVAPLGADPDAAFAPLGDLSRGLQADHPGAWRISAGMSGDLEAAVRAGATHLRVGSAVLGERPPLEYRPNGG